MRYPTAFERFLNRSYSKIFSIEKIILVTSLIVFFLGMFISSNFQHLFTFRNYMAVVITYLVFMHLFKKIIHVVVDLFNFIFLDQADLSRKND